MTASTENQLIAGRYADALFAIAAPAKAQDAALADLEGIAKLARESRDFRTLLASPLVSRNQAEAALKAILAKKGAHKITMQFLAALAQNRRLALLPAVAERFAERVEQSRGELTARVETAGPLDDALRAQIIQALSQATGKKVKLWVSEVPALIGGMVAHYAGKRLDLSVAGRLERLSQNLRAA